MPPPWVHALTGSPDQSRTVLLEECAQPCIVEIANRDGASLVAARVPNAIRLSADVLRTTTMEMLLLVLRSLRQTRNPNPVRMWNFVPGIHAPMGIIRGEEMDRYRVFNLGRYDAFCDWLGGTEAFGRALPTASGVGHFGDHLYIYALGVPSPGVPAENPRQVPAFQYSRTYGPRPPCFARATVATLPIGERLLVAGTASVRGEESVHLGSLGAQFRETFNNLEILARSAPGDAGFDLSGIETARIYYPRSSDLTWLSEHAQAMLPAHAQIEYVHADICRAELLVEVEVTIAPGG